MVDGIINRDDAGSSLNNGGTPRARFVPISPHVLAMFGQFWPSRPAVQHAGNAEIPENKWWARQGLNL
jgi:hypothetical protein